jgi:hypothetical protein
MLNGPVEIDPELTLRAVKWRTAKCSFALDVGCLGQSGIRPTGITGLGLGLQRLDVGEINYFWTTAHFAFTGTGSSRMLKKLFCEGLGV